MHKNDKLAKEFKEKVLNENIKDAVKSEVKAMSEIEWEEGMVCFSGGRQILFTAKADPILGDIFGLEDWIKINEDFQLNEIRQGDYIEASELDTEQKYNDAVAELELFGFTGLKSHKGYDRYTTSSLTLGDGFYCYSTNGSRKITYPQLMSIGKLKRIMIKSDEEETCIEEGFDQEQFEDEMNAEFKLLPKVDGNKYHRTIYGLCGTPVKVDVYRVSDAFPTGSAPIDHAVKKMLCAGLRGHKDKLTDIDNAIESLQAARLLLIQKGEV